MAHAEALAAIPARQSSTDWLAVAATTLTVVATVLLIVPTLVLVIKSFISDATGSGDLSNYAEILQARKLSDVLINTAVLGFGSLVVIFTIALPLAWLFARTNFRWRRAILTAATAQIAMPGFLATLGYIFMFNPTNGLVNQGWRAWSGQPHALFDIYSMGWMVLLQGLALVGPALYFLVPIFSSIDGALEEAASAHGIGKGATFFRILLPISLPALFSSSIFFLVISIETFDYAGMLGMPARIDVIATWIYQFTQSSFTEPEYGLASAVGVLTAIVLLALMAAQGLVFKRSAEISTLGGRARAPSIRLSPQAQAVGILFFLTYVLAGLALPLLTLIWMALSPVPQLSAETLQQLSLDAFGPSFWMELQNTGSTTVLLALTIPTAVIGLTSAMAWTARRSVAADRGIETIVVANLAVPSIVIAVVFSVGALQMHAYVPLYGTIAVMMLAIGTRYLATAYRITRNSFRQVSKELDEAGRTCGVPAGRLLIHVIIPVIKYGLGFAWFWVALLTLRELPISLVLSNYELQTLASRIFFLNSSGDTRQAAALSLALFAIIFVFLVALLVFMRSTFRSGERT
ncbi:iron(III) transport system permease protein [Beijerinckia sp. GAS462]|nr:iron(III) transport system permease protein [Beijerinckia sp. GAS462]SED89115.1 iron(III) transport system permease protein [Beijerinckia sp. 28-YEA-48]